MVRLPQGHAPNTCQDPLSFPPLAGSVLRLTFVSDRHLGALGRLSVLSLFLLFVHFVTSLSP